MSSVEVNKRKSLTGHKGALYALQALDAFRFLSAGGDGMVVAWDLRTPDTGQMIVKVSASIYAMNYNPGKKLLIVGQNFSGIHLIDVETKKELRSVKLTTKSIFDIQSTETAIFVGTEEGELIQLDWDFNILCRLKLSEKSLRTIAIDSSKGDLALGFSDFNIKILHVKTLEERISYQAHENSVFTLSYHPELPILISAGRDSRLKFWDVDRNYVAVEEIVAHIYAINHVTFSPDKQHFVTCSMDKAIKVWDSKGLKLLKVIDKARHAGHASSVNKLLWMDHEQTLVSCSDDQTISLWGINFKA